MAKSKKSNSITTPHDSFFKANLSEKSKMVKIIHNHLPKSIIKQMDLSTLDKKSTDFIQKNLQTLVSDVLYSVKVNDKDAYIYLLWEHQSSEDMLMAFRILQYSVQIMQNHLNKGHGKLPLIIPGVIYHGEKSPCPFSNNIFDCFDDPLLAKKYAFKEFELVDLTTLDDDKLAKFDPDLLFEYMLKYSRDNLIEHLTKWLLKHPEQSVYFLNARKNLLFQVFSYIDSRKETNKKSVEKLIDVINQNTDGDFMNYLEKMELRATKKGMEQGRIHEKQETARNMLAKELPPKLVAECTGLELETVHELKKDIDNKNKR
ncbi:Rpn family recombination-promoting nuclease/putative transposase [Thiotrichales bacterium 19S9-12]|nr:Rpn family recombination-promoting nuclease/putative transposase [Thiotrichales bacterium 19S9-11]MCF6812515.1 Rpn family recombination-promoting nuclease/putative transposase [Thiotrichales bacterium 19S9-12]